MKELKQWIVGSLVVLILFAGMIYGFGWFGVGYKKTVGKELQKVDREIYEEMNSFTKAKRQEIIKAYKEYNNAETETEKKAIAKILSLSLADFDEDKFIKDKDLLQFVKQVKY